jgi:hypothetical protein
MTESEILENYWNSQELGVAVLTMFISVFSAYLLAAFLAGTKLTRFQAGFISSAFTLFGLVVVWGTFVYWTEGYNAALSIEESHPAITIIRANPAWIFVVLEISAIVGGILFMLDIRKRKSG